MGSSSSRQRERQQQNLSVNQILTNKIKSDIYDVNQIKLSLGIFWDIENCPIPYNKSASGVAKRVRDFIGAKHPNCGYAKEFFCVCDTRKLDPLISEALNRNGVFVVHVNSGSKNAADDRLQELIDMFVDKFGQNSVLCVITGDINFAKPIRNARRNGIHVMLIHCISCSVDLKSLANESHLFDDMIRYVGQSANDANYLKPAFLKVTDLPIDKPIASVRHSLFKLSNNCGGKPTDIADGVAVIRFGNRDDAQRAKQRMADEEVFGQKINVNLIEDKLNNGTDIWSQNSSQISKSNNTVVTDQPTSNYWPVHTNETKGWVNMWSDVSKKYELKYIIIANSLLNFYKNPLEQILESIDLKTCDLVIENSNIFIITYFKYGRTLSSRFKTSSELECNKYLRAFKGAKVAISTRFVANTKASNVSDDKKIQTNGNINSVNSYLSDDRKSLIYGLTVAENEKPLKVVRRLVHSWKDRKLNGNLITDVIQSHSIGNSTWIVIATCADACNSLVNGAKKYMKSNANINWTHYRTKQFAALNPHKGHNQKVVANNPGTNTQKVQKDPMLNLINEILKRQNLN